MAVPLYLADIQHRYTPVGASEPYYWTSWWHFSSTHSDPTADPAYNALLTADSAGTLDTVERVSVKLQDIANSGPVSIITIGPPVGDLPDNGGGGLINCVRLVGRKAGKEVCYKRWRVPLRAEDYDGIRLADGIKAVFTDVIVPLLGDGDFCNVHRDIVDEWVVDPTVSMYQLRRGTKRRQGPVYAY